MTMPMRMEIRSLGTIPSGYMTFTLLSGRPSIFRVPLDMSFWEIQTVRP